MRMDQNLQGRVRHWARSWPGLSMGALWTITALCALLWTAAGQAHEIRPAVADVEIGPERAQVSIQLTAETLVAGIDVSALENTDDAPEAAAYDALRALSPEEMAETFRAAWPEVSQGLIAEVDGVRLDWELGTVTVSGEAALELPRDTLVTAEIALPDGVAPLILGWDAANGPLVVRQAAEAEGEGYSAYLTGGTLSDPLPREGVAAQSMGAAFVNYVVIGFEHIIPKGLDHILFVLGLFFFSLALKPLLIQVTAFTLAHTVTLAMATLGVVSLPASVVEPLIAASIVYVAVENIIGGTIGWRRTAVVFAFGLLHGLGFASVLGDVGLNPGQFVTSLIGFNIGVELGQLAVIALAFVLIGLPFGKKEWYRRVIAIPVSAAIAFVGAYWAVERVFF